MYIPCLLQLLPLLAILSCSSALPTNDTAASGPQWTIAAYQGPVRETVCTGPDGSHPSYMKDTIAWPCHNLDAALHCADAFEGSHDWNMCAYPNPNCQGECIAITRDTYGVNAPSGGPLRSISVKQK
jgi:hypothetical protein